jgi:hypothetical protein
LAPIRRSHLSGHDRQPQFKPIERSPAVENPPCTRSNSPARSGVATIPISVDAEALHSAAATLSRAIQVNATEACTVEGSVHKSIELTVNFSAGLFQALDAA